PNQLHSAPAITNKHPGGWFGVSLSCSKHCYNNYEIVTHETVRKITMKNIYYKDQLCDLCSCNVHDLYDVSLCK
ncbi:hypothetical protein LINGRAHAP2_LOCUS27483, partial [Linum grandiflorum]